jgi:ParB family chromosome partitioning protein
MNPRKSALGRGLGALLDNPSTEANAGSGVGDMMSVSGNIANISLSKIETNPFQPRTEFSTEALQELAESIKNQGIIQPITVRKSGMDKYQIISGERRFRASKLAGLDSVPAYIRVANDQAMLEMALVENIQRKDLNAIEIAISYKRLIDECNLTQETLADKVGKDRTTVTNYLRLLKLMPQIQAALRDEQITMGHARAIINVADHAKQLDLFRQIIANNLSVRETEKLVKLNSPVASKPKTESAITSDFRSLQDKLSSIYETKVLLKPNAGGKGQIVINYYSIEDLNRLIDMLDFE